MMARAAERLWTIEDLLAFEDGTDARYELHAGRLVAMAPAAQAHGEIVARLVVVLGRNLTSPCRVMTEAGIPVRDFAESYYQADLAVTCEPREARQVWVREPVVVVEVLSPSTAAIDFQQKLPDYRRLATLRHILLVDSTRPLIHHLVREGERWLIADAEPGDTIDVAAISAAVDVAALYRDIPLERRPPATRGSSSQVDAG
jgi:Uma2 family endonuclease